VRKLQTLNPRRGEFRMFNKKKVGSIVLFACALLVLIGSVYSTALAKEKTVLVTGYGWYKEIPPGQINNAELVAHALAGEKIAGALIQTVIIPVTWKGAIPPVIDAIQRLDPVLVVGIGTFEGIPAVRIEKYGCNVSYDGDSSFPKPVMRGKDANGKVIYEPIDPQGPAWEEAILPIPIENVVKSLLEAGIPSEAGSKYQKEGYPNSMWFSTAGEYLCNWEAYSVPRYIKSNKLTTKFVFIHIPTQPEYVAIDLLAGRKKAPVPSMSLNVSINGVRAAIKTILESME